MVSSEAMRARRILPILVLILSGGFQPIVAQEPADTAAEFRLSFKNKRPLLHIRDNNKKMLPSGLATVTIEALDSRGKKA